jgi:hypothetical protein
VSVTNDQLAGNITSSKIVSLPFNKITGVSVTNDQIISLDSAKLFTLIEKE